MTEKNQENIPVTDEIISTEEALKDLVSKNIYLFGHGTGSEDNASNAVKEGLHTKYDDLYSTVLGMEGLADNPDAYDHDLALIKNWPHYGLKYVVMLGVERLQDEQIPNRRYLDSIVQPRPGQENFDPSYGLRNTIDPRFIAGYFDVAGNRFIANPSFDPTYDSNLLETTVNNHIQRERNPMTAEEAMKRMGDMATVEEIEIPSDNHGHGSYDNHNDGPLVW